VKIGPVEPEIIGLQEIIKKRRKNNASKTHTTQVCQVCHAG